MWVPHSLGAGNVGAPFTWGWQFHLGAGNVASPLAAGRKSYFSRLHLMFRALRAHSPGANIAPMVSWKTLPQYQLGNA